jgi:hypothetical protein
METGNDDLEFSADDVTLNEQSANDAPVDDENKPPVNKKHRREHIIIAVVAALVLLVIGILLFRGKRGCCHCKD